MEPCAPVSRTSFLRQPLIRLLAVNLGIGVASTVLMLGGLLLANPAGLRDLIFADRAPEAALGLLALGFLITLGSAAMGSAIMTLGHDAPATGGTHAPATGGTPAPPRRRGTLEPSPARPRH